MEELKHTVVDVEVLAKKREELRLKQAEVGELVDKSNKNISHYEKKRALPDANTLLRLMILYNLSPQELAKVQN